MVAWWSWCDDAPIHGVCMRRGCCVGVRVAEGLSRCVKGLIRSIKFLLFFFSPEIPYDQGCTMLRIFRSYRNSTSILDDFAWYDDRQKAMEEQEKSEQEREKKNDVKNGLTNGSSAEDVRDKSRSASNAENTGVDSSSTGVAGVPNASPKQQHHRGGSGSRSVKQHNIEINRGSIDYGLDHQSNSQHSQTV